MTNDRFAPPHDGDRHGDELTLPTCSCGHDRRHYMVSAECKYTAWGWFRVSLIGASARPIKAVFRCRSCGEVIEETTDPAILDQLI